MRTLADLSRHWSSRSEKRRGLCLDADALDLLNAHGVGELIHRLAGEEQRKEGEARLAQRTARTAVVDHVGASQSREKAEMALASVRAVLEHGRKR